MERNQIHNGDEISFPKKSKKVKNLDQYENGNPKPIESIT